MKQPSSTMLPEILSDGPVKICRSDKDNLTLPAVTEVVMRNFYQSVVRFMNAGESCGGRGGMSPSLL